MFIDFYTRALHIFNWKDCVEILLISAVIYYFSCWLKTDKQKSLLFYFYGYCLVFFATHYMGLYAFHSLLLGLLPITLFSFIFIHQTTLQKNFIALHKIHTSFTKKENWINLLVQASLVALSANKRFYCVIEKHDSLETFIDKEIIFNCPFSEELFSLIIQSSSFDCLKLLWLNNQGTLKGINCSWLKNSIETWLSKDIQEQEESIQNAILFSTKTDLIFITADPATRTYTIVHSGKIQEHISTNTVLAELKKYFNSFSYSQGEVYASTYTHQNKSFEQLRS